MHTFRLNIGTALAVLALLLAVPPLTLAHGDPHPVHIHEGTCADLAAAPLYPLTDITEPGHAAEATGSPIIVKTSVTTVDAPLADLAVGNRAINVHASADDLGTSIACGDIGGAIVAGDDGEMLAIGLAELNDSGFSGIAVLQASGDQTVVSVYLAEGLSSAVTMGGKDHSEATAVPESEGATVDMLNLAYDPPTITIAAGESVTWTNRDAAPHTVTARDRDVLQSGTMDEGESFTVTFDTPGTYEYFCEFHANMSGTIIVEAP